MWSIRKPAKSCKTPARRVNRVNPGVIVVVTAVAREGTVVVIAADVAVTAAPEGVAIAARAVTVTTTVPLRITSRPS